MLRFFMVIAIIILDIFADRLAYCDKLTMQNSIDAALDANPEIRATANETEAAYAKPSQAATPPDPEFMVDFIGVPSDTANVGQGTIQYMVEQKIPFPSKLVYGYRALKRQAQTVESGTMATRQEIIRQTKRAYIETWRLEEEEKINRETLSIYRQSKGSAETAYATTKGPIVDPVRASVELGDIEGQLAVVEGERLEALANFSRIIAKHLDVSTKTESPHIPQSIEKIDILINKAKEDKPEISQAEHEVEFRMAESSMAKAQYGPDLTLRWGFMDNPTGLPNAWYGRVGVSLPLWSLSKQRFAVRESDAMLRRARAIKEEAELSSEADVRAAHARLAGAKKVVEVYENRVVPRVKLLVSSTLEAYKSNKGDFLSVTESIRSLNNARIALVKAKADTAKALADLERATGKTFAPSDEAK